MQLDFFPSRTLALYIAQLFVVRLLGVLLMLVLILQMLDLLSESGKIMAQAGNGEAQLWTYVSLRMPQRLQRIAILALGLLMTAATFAGLG